MEFIYIGKIVNTHGIKGEIRILSEFKYKKEVFKKGFKLYIGKDKTEETISTYRYHKIYDMITFININDINDVLKYKGLDVYAKKEDIKINGYFDEDLIGLEAIVNDRVVGIVTEVFKSKAHDILVIEKNKLENLVPNIDEFIEKVDLENKKIYIKEIEGLLNEN